MSRMAGSLSEAKFRPALPEDYEAVMAIGEQYNGRDYLPTCYHDYMNNPYRYCSLGEVDGKVITFVMFYIVDDGKAVAKQAGRTHPDYRKRGLMEKVVDYTCERIAKSGKYPNVQKIYTVTTSLTKPSKKEIVLARKACYLMVSPSQMIRKFTWNFLENEITEISVANIQKLNVHGTLNVLKSQQNKSHLFPTGYFLCAGEPFKVLDCNFDRILSDTYTLYTFADVLPGHVCRSLSFGVLRHCGIGIRYDLDVYGTDNVETAKGHVLQHLSNLKFCGIQKDIHIRVTLQGPRQNLDKVFKYCLSDLEMQPRLGPYPKKEIWLLLISAEDYTYNQKPTSKL